MAADPGLERRIVSVLFADLVGFTTLSERLDPEDVALIQDAYFAGVRDTIGRYAGRLEKFIGDAAMAVFGIPRTRDDDAERAVRAGLALASSVAQLAARVGLEEGALRLRVGVNTGEVVHGGGDIEGEWRVTGDTVNVAARLQTAAPPGGVLIGPTTSLAVEEAIELEPMGALDLKGKAEPLPAWLALEARPVPSREHAMGSLRAPILGREDELAVLRDAFGRVREGRSERLVFVAPPGVGKSRLVEEFARLASAEGADVRKARLRPDVLAPFQPVTQLLMAAHPNAGAAIAAVDAALRGAAAPGRAGVVADEVRSLLSPSTEGDERATGPADREARFAAWLEALEALSGDRPAVWIVEDAHWAGGDLLAFLDRAGRMPSAGRRLVVVTTRPSLLEQASEWCTGDDATGVVELPPLSSPDAGALVRALIGDALTEDLVDAVAQRSDGNPLFVEELLRTWIGVGTLVTDDGGGWRLATPAGEVPLPATVQAIYAAQIDDLPATAREAARRASVAGRRFAIEALAPMGVGDPAPAVDILGRRALVSGPQPDPLLGSMYLFRHALLRDAGYASLARAERARLHVRLARWLEEAAGPGWAEVAEVIGNHYRAALRSVPALAPDVGDGLSREETQRLAAEWFERAADAALELSAHDAARTLLRESLDLTPETAPLDRARRTHRLGDATAYVSDMDEGAIAYEAASALFREAMETTPSGSVERATAREGFASAVTALGLVRIQQLRFKDASALADDALAAIGPGEDLSTGWLLFLRGWGVEAFHTEPEVAEDLRRAVDLAERLGDRRLQLEAGWHLAGLGGDEDSSTRAEAAEQDLVTADLAIELGEWPQASRSFRSRAMLLATTGREPALAALDRAREVVEARLLTEERAWCDYVEAEILFLAGEWEEALAAGLRALDLADAGAYHRVQVRTWFAVSPMALARGRDDVLRRAAGWFLEYASIFPGSPFGNVMHGAIECRLAAAGLSPEPDLDPADLLPAWTERQVLPSWDAAVESIVQTWISQGRLDDARQVLNAVGRWLDHPITEDVDRSSEALLRSRLLLAEGDRARAAEAAKIAVKAARAARAPWWLARALRELTAAGGDPGALAEATSIERGLGVVRPLD